MSEELVKLVEPEIEEIQKIIKKPCKIEFQTEGKYPLTGYKITATISGEAQFPWQQQICRFHLSQFPGNCAMMVTQETYQPSEYRRKGLSVPIQAMKAKISKHLKYTILLATTVPSNYNDNVLIKAGFSKIEPLCFVSARTAAVITTWMKKLA